jgi:hypothetical protein
MQHLSCLCFIQKFSDTLVENSLYKGRRKFVREITKKCSIELKETLAHKMKKVSLHTNNNTALMLNKIRYIYRNDMTRIMASLSFKSDA